MFVKLSKIEIFNFRFRNYTMIKKYVPKYDVDMFKGAPTSSFSKAESLRKTMTEAETRLWNGLKGKKLNGLKFRRQHPVHLYIADFYCHKLGLIIEVDGGYHQTKEQSIKDKNRTDELEHLGITVLRFSNDEVIDNIEKVLNKILSSAKKLK